MKDWNEYLSIGSNCNPCKWNIDILIIKLGLAQQILIKIRLI
jgi:hypothetical protein